MGGSFGVQESLFLGAQCRQGGGLPGPFGKWIVALWPTVNSVQASVPEPNRLGPPVASLPPNHSLQSLQRIPTTSDPTAHPTEQPFCSRTRPPEAQTWAHTNVTKVFRCQPFSYRPLSPAGAGGTAVGSRFTAPAKFQHTRAATHTHTHTHPHTPNAPTRNTFARIG